MDEFDEGQIDVVEYFIADYEGANDVTFGGSEAWNANACVVDGASSENGIVYS